MFQGYQEVVGKLSHVEEASDGNWKARCPAHDDKTASLSLKVARDDGRLLVTCHAGCSFQEIASALGVLPRQFFNQQEGAGVRTTQAETVYDYHNAGGELVFQAVRKQPKDFRQRRPDGNGGWLWNLSGVERVLYHLPELNEADPKRVVFVVEGEKDVETLRANGMLATCNPGGAGKWRREFTTALSNRNVAIIPDNDAAGLKHAYEVAGALHGSAATVRIISLPSLPDKGDVTDWFSGGGSVGELQTLFKSVEIYDGTAPDFQMASRMHENGPRTPEQRVAESIGAKDTAGHREAVRLSDGVQRIVRAASPLAGDPWAFVYFALGVMEELKRGKEING